jgi:hypothetical protein
MGKVRAVAGAERTKLLATMLQEARQSSRYFVAMCWMESGPLTDVEAQCKYNLNQDNPVLVAQTLFLLGGPFERSRLYQAGLKPEDAALLRRLQAALLGLTQQPGRMTEPLANDYLARLLWELKDEKARPWLGSFYLKALKQPPPVTQSRRWEAIDRVRDLKVVEAVPILTLLVTDEVTDGHAAWLAARALLQLQGQDALPVLAAAASKNPQRGNIAFGSMVQQLMGNWRAENKL